MTELVRQVQLEDGVTLAVRELGAGPAVVLLHGWPVSSFHWRLTAPALAAAGFRPIRIDLRGLGESNGGPAVYAKEALARDVIGLLDRMDVRECAVAGHDWGGTVGYLLAADHPRRVIALVVEEELLPGSAVALVEPGRSHYPAWHAPFLRQPGLAEALVPGHEEAFYGTFLEQSAGPAGLGLEAMRSYLEAYRRPAALSASLGYYRSAAADSEAVARRAASKIACPVLTIGGEFGFGLAVGECFSSLATAARHLQVANAGHYPAEQFPELVNAALVTFVRACMADGTP